ncbi:MAG: ChbG/HpnK family deacetylase [Phenylobacterium sp.]|nr:MAG: ChbG/HpnK family deacetylase [Phenylobacterium sp.]
MAEAGTSLVERLGYAPADRLIIVNCDDLGSSHTANLASLEAFELGIATSGTLMVPCPWAREAVELFQGHDVGVHLTLTAEYPTYRWRALTGAASLHDDQGFLPRSVEEVRARADPADVRRECRAQIEQALAWGVDVTHLDAHMGTVQLDPRFFEIYVELAADFRLPLRMVGPRAATALGFDSRAIAAAAGLVFPDALYAQWGRPTDQQMRAEFPKLTPGVAEFLLHPVHDGPELRGYDLTEAEIRLTDQRCSVDPAIAALIAAERLITISFRPLRELQRGRVVVAPAATG